MSVLHTRLLSAVRVLPQAAAPSRTLALPLRQTAKLQRRLESSSSTQQSVPQQQPHPQQQPAKRPSPYALIFNRAFAKVFLGAMLTYQVLYWAWEKLRIDEARRSMLEEVDTLEKEVQEYQAKKGT